MRARNKRSAAIVGKHRGVRVALLRRCSLRREGRHDPARQKSRIHAICASQQEAGANVDAGEQRPICREARGVEVPTCPQTASSEAWLITKTNIGGAPALEKANEAGGGRER